jgi:PRTRC genetic system protein A
MSDIVRIPVSLVGYRLNTKVGLTGEPGEFYDYILAGNGLFIRAESPLIAATLHVTPTDIRGLLPLKQEVSLVRGKIYLDIYDVMFSILREEPGIECYMAVTWEGAYLLRYPSQKGDGDSVQYECLRNTVMDVHSHGSMSAFFSSQDDQDEQGLRLSMVFGRMDTTPEYDLRLGVYGYFAPVSFDEVFVSVPA